MEIFSRLLFWTMSTVWLQSIQLVCLLDHIHTQFKYLTILERVLLLCLLYQSSLQCKLFQHHLVPLCMSIDYHYYCHFYVYYNDFYISFRPSTSGQMTRGSCNVLSSTTFTHYFKGVSSCSPQTGKGKHKSKCIFHIV